MISIRPMRPRIDSQAVEILLRDLYEISGAVQELPSERDRNYRITTDSGVSYVFKIANANEDRNNLDFQNKMLGRLAKTEIATHFPIVVDSVSGEKMHSTAGPDNEQHLVRLLTYLDGQPLSQIKNRTPELIRSLGDLLGRMDNALTGFDHPAAHRDFYGDLAGAVDTIHAHKSRIGDASHEKLIDHVLAMYDEIVRPHLPELRQSVIHNDANDNNILTGFLKDEDTSPGALRTTGLIAFGDAIYSHTINNLAVAIAYAMLEADNPLRDAGLLADGYHRQFPLTETEFDVLFTLACMRLSLSIFICTYQQQLEPENEYLRISEQPAWTLLEQVCRIDPYHATCSLRHACNLPPRPESVGMVRWHEPQADCPVDKSHDQLLRERRKLIGPSLSVSYEKPLKIVRGFMQYLYDDKGRQYLDAVNNVPHVGHCHPEVVAAGQKQMALLNTNTRYLHYYLTEYAARLTATLPEDLSVCYFVCSGSEANELALRLAQAHTKGREFVVIDGAYHGNTGLLVNLSPYKFNGPGGHGAADFVHTVPTPDCFRGKYRGHGTDLARQYASHVTDAIAEIASAGKKPAALLAESIMGCAGQIVFPDGYLKEAYELVRSAGGVCIADEVQIGFGRVGSSFWAFETQNVVPDIVTLGKPIGNGHPLGAVVTTPAIAASFDTGMEYFNTFGGNPVSCAIGLAVLDVIENEGLQENAMQVGGYLKQRLTDLMDRFEIIGEVRGLGLFIGVELVIDRGTLTPATSLAKLVVEKMKEGGVLLSADGPDENVIKIKPPIIFNRENADRLVDSLAKILEGVH